MTQPQDAPSILDRPITRFRIAPGLGLKFPADGVHQSQNAVVMRMLDAQDTGSVFEHPSSAAYPQCIEAARSAGRAVSRLKRVSSPPRGR
jgi:hypothetical protein